MQNLVLDEDIRPLSEFRSKCTAFLKQVHDTKRPMVITQRGRSAAVLLDVGEYQAMVERLELLEDIQRAETELEQGLGVDHAKAKARVLEGLRK
ncbi:MAG: prevent-host-death family protein [Lentisphaerae bacterium RIFOXYB12_FULL_65_16]|nr:MAG: prevent-host-death family protein [Lentisphaerae bacterium RIFOXYA12_64_32]OGV85792.1 MAG: prevent-host-death family protein [Lentisphaerae bacterium RIFOXYB12_FULL_65_16]